MNFLYRLCPSLVPRAAAPARAPAPAGAGGDDGPQCLGCGWFDSSHELQTGLQVSEHEDDEVVAAALPLATWLDLQLADWHPAICGESH